MKKIIVTGATGLIGSQIIEPLYKQGYEICILSRKSIEIKNATVIKCDLFNENNIKKVFAEVKPSYLIHLAWFTGENYLNSNVNFDYINASMNLLKYFHVNGGKRAVFAGTCFEYNFIERPLKEADTLNPATVYAKTKCILNELATLFCQKNNISFTWGRIFYVFGKNENPKRLIGSLFKHLEENIEIVINSGSLIRDFMYTKDIACAFVTVLKSDIEGAVNICSGQGINIKDLVITFARSMDKEYLVKFEDNVGSQPKTIVGDDGVLRKIGFEIEFNVAMAVEDIIKERN